MGQQAQGVGPANGCREEYQTAGDDNVDEAEHQISFRGVKLIVAQEISHLWEPPEWSNFSNPAHNRLQFSLKLPKQRRFSALKGLEIECREIYV